MDLLDGFDGPEVATLLVSLAAAGVSVWAIVRTRAPKPHWVGVVAMAGVDAHVRITRRLVTSIASAR